ncbi:MAG: hypothetical protein AAGD35_01170 [Actinomycetota bacterium]
MKRRYPLVGAVMLAIVLLLPMAAEAQRDDGAPVVPEPPAIDVADLTEGLSAEQAAELERRYRHVWQWLWWLLNGRPGPEPQPPTAPTLPAPTSVPAPAPRPSPDPTTAPTPTIAVPPTAPPSNAPPTSSVTAAPPSTAPPTPAPPQPDGVAFFEDFSAPGSLDRFEFEIHHRDDFVVSTETWEGDHAVTGPNDLCGPPEEKRIITRGNRANGFNDDWIYRCVPGGNTDLAHIMTSIGDTSGYSIGGFAPKQSFSGVTEVRWDVNITEMGGRQFPEVKIMPASSVDFQDLPCAVEWLPCDTSTHGQLGSVGVSFMNHQMWINGGSGEQSLSDHWGREWLYPGDPAVDSIRTRRTHFFRDNGDGTLTFGIETEDGSFHEVSAPGRFPSGPVRVVFADHNYTPTKDDIAPREMTFSWHWDDIMVITGGNGVVRTSAPALAPSDSLTCEILSGPLLSLKTAPPSEPAVRRPTTTA